MANNDSTLNALFAALADPTRRAVLADLVNGAAPVSELAAPHAMALPSFMKHISMLEGAGLINTRKSGRIRTCELAPQALKPVRGWLEGQQALWDGRLDRLTAHLHALEQETKQ